ncbi:membrane protein [Streptomyces viridochromogenes]|uniref:Membrane protein n=1 Tax=Streptomyces viridochromogenes TaxID=1938 RepID=A0A0J7YV09_STRVR|nr:YihY/virulence factor BrkB family protein [Streptomyces viridochromogenes]KMS67302.1 membrane protein [Streptomyces viridochromogenes]KOG15289.1 membrane protein [Streptomyces viridochromogenes]KOG24556.1 membrane protein [Streptomyces viridochromogenes]
MDWLKKLPVVGSTVTRLMTTHAWRSYERMDRVKWTRLAAAMTFTSFVALFPLLTVAAAIAAATLSKEQQDKLEDRLTDQVPGISDQLDIDALVQNAGTVGLIAGALLLFTGIGWVGSMRECLRAVWELPEDEGNPVLRKAKDAGVLVGFGGAVLLTLAASAVASAMVGWITRQLGIDEGGWGGVLLQIAAFLVAVLADFLLLLYVLTLLPRVEPPRRRLMVAALIGAVGFELLKLLLSGYMQGVATKSMYGAFGVPVALLLWINFTAKLVVFCAAWTATQGKESELVDESGEPDQSEEPGGSGEPDGPDEPGRPGKPGLRNGPDGAPGRAAATGG